MEQPRDAVREEVRRANRAALQVCLMHACVLEATAWGGYIAAPRDALAELELEVRVRRATARQLRKQARLAKRASERLDLPEQIW